MGRRLGGGGWRAGACEGKGALGFVAGYETKVMEEYEEDCGCKERKGNAGGEALKRPPFPASFTRRSKRREERAAGDDIKIINQKQFYLLAKIYLEFLFLVSLFSKKYSILL